MSSEGAKETSFTNFPNPHCAIGRPGNDDGSVYLRADDSSHVIVVDDGVDAGAGLHVPYLHGSIAAAGDDEILIHLDGPDFHGVSNQLMEKVSTLSAENVDIFRGFTTDGNNLVVIELEVANIVVVFVISYLDCEHLRVSFPEVFGDMVGLEKVNLPSRVSNSWLFIPALQGF